MSKNKLSLIIAAALALGTAGLQAATPGFPSSSNEAPALWWQDQARRGSAIEASGGAIASVFPSASNEVPVSWWQGERPRASVIATNVGVTGSTFPSASNETVPGQSAAETGGDGFRTLRGGTRGVLPRGQYQHGTPHGE